MDDKIRRILSAVFDIPAAEVREETGPENVGLWDSLNHLRMATEIEKEFGIRLRQKEIREMRSFAKIREAVARNLPPSQGS